MENSKRLTESEAERFRLQNRNVKIYDDWKEKKTQECIVFQEKYNDLF